MAATLTNCRIKAVFGGLTAASARLMAEELFINKLDPMKIKVAIYQTKFWPKEETRQVRTRGTSHTSSSGWSESSASGTSICQQHGRILWARAVVWHRAVNGQQQPVAVPATASLPAAVRRVPTATARANP